MPQSPGEETLQQKNQRRLDLYSEFGGLIGAIVERETGIDLARATDCIDCLLTHATEVLAIYYALDEEVAQECFKMMKYQVQQRIKEVQAVRKEANEKLPEGTVIEVPGEESGS